MKNNNKKLFVGARGSKLALAQIDEVFQLLAKVDCDVKFISVAYETSGDKDKKSSLSENTRDDFFTDRLDEALLADEIDIAIHSAKDLPQKLTNGIEIVALTHTIDSTDAFVGPCPLKEMKKGSIIGTSSLLRTAAIKETKPQCVVTDIRGDILERLQLIDDGKIDGLIVASCALKRLGLEDKITEIMPWKTTPLQGQLATVAKVGNLSLKKLFSLIDVRKNYGKVYLVGAGPGDPELITLKGIKELNKADCVFYDYLIHKDLLNHAPNAEKIYVGKRKGQHTLPQGELNDMLKQKAMTGQSVVRLKGGDPFVFGRGAEEIIVLRAHHIEVEVVPGVSSATAIPSGLGIPLTARGVSSSVAFLSGHGSEEEEENSALLNIS